MQLMKNQFEVRGRGCLHNRPFYFSIVFVNVDGKLGGKLRLCICFSSPQTIAGELVGEPAPVILSVL